VGKGGIKDWRYTRSACKNNKSSFKIWCSFLLPSLRSCRLFRRTDGQTDMAILNRLLMLIKNIYTLWGLPRLLPAPHVQSLLFTHSIYVCLNRPDRFTISYSCHRNNRFEINI